jgi:hypothetical protein
MIWPHQQHNKCSKQSQFGTLEKLNASQHKSLQDHDLSWELPTGEPFVNPEASHVTIVGEGWSDFKIAYHIDHIGIDFLALQSYQSHKNCNDTSVFLSTRQMMFQS